MMTVSIPQNTNPKPIIEEKNRMQEIVCGMKATAEEKKEAVKMVRDSLEEEPENYSEFDKFDEQKDEILNKE